MMVNRYFQLLSVSTKKWVNMSFQQMNYQHIQSNNEGKYRESQQNKGIFSE